jgi:hypothetical protein
MGEIQALYPWGMKCDWVIIEGECGEPSMCPSTPSTTLFITQGCFAIIHFTGSINKGKFMQYNDCAYIIIHSTVISGKALLIGTRGKGVKMSDWVPAFQSGLPEHSGGILLRL